MVRTFQPPRWAVCMTCSAVRQSRVTVPNWCQASWRAVKNAAVPSSKISISCGMSGRSFLGGDFLPVVVLVVPGGRQMSAVGEPVVEGVDVLDQLIQLGGQVIR